MNDIQRYETFEQKSGKLNRLLFAFVSKGKQDIQKLIVYTDVERDISIPKRGKLRIFNLGFGDKRQGTYEVDDKNNSNNGDMHKVFNTVLSTIPSFFDAFPESSVYVSGSDQRRTKVYCYFVSKHYDTLINDYVFYGYDGKQLIEFKKLELYEGILFFKK